MASFYRKMHISSYISNVAYSSRRFPKARDILRGLQVKKSKSARD